MVLTWHAGPTHDKLNIADVAHHISNNTLPSNQLTSIALSLWNLDLNCQIENIGMKCNCAFLFGIRPTNTRGKKKALCTYDFQKSCNYYYYIPSSSAL